MALFPISQEGADEFRGLAERLRSYYEEGNDLGEKLLSAIGDASVNELGEFYDPIRANACSVILACNVTAGDGVRKLAARLVEMADRIEELTRMEESDGAGTAEGAETPPAPEEAETRFARANDALYAEYLETASAGDYEESSDFQYVDARLISGAFYNDAPDMSWNSFWAHHGYNKDMFLRMAEQVPNIQRNILDLNASSNLEVVLEEIGNLPDDAFADLKACAVNYFKRDRAIRVHQYKDHYMFDGEGRHRALAAMLLGIRIPVLITRKYKKR